MKMVSGWFFKRLQECQASCGQLYTVTCTSWVRGLLLVQDAKFRVRGAGWLRLKEEQAGFAATKNQPCCDGHLYKLRFQGSYFEGGVVFQVSGGSWG